MLFPRTDTPVIVLMSDSDTPRPPFEAILFPCPVAAPPSVFAPAAPSNDTPSPVFPSAVSDALRPIQFP